jgi:hypothetical protein
MQRRWLRAAWLMLAMLALLGNAAARAGVANLGVPGAPAGNPLTGIPWGNYDGRDDEVFPAYRAASGERKRLLGLIATRPRMRWYGQWYGDAQAAARDYVANVTAGNPDALVQMAVFGLKPWEGDACRRLPTAGEQAAYRHWIDEFAAGLGSARAAIVLQPDLPFALCVPRHSTLPLTMVAYAARRFASLPHASVYIDVGASDWPALGQASSMLRHAGIAYVRGFALGATHYASTADEIRFGARLVQALDAHGIRDRHFVINTAQNGAPFTHQEFHGSNFDNAAVCHRRGQQRCVTLGIPPTTDVASPRWHLSPGVRRQAARSVDAYLWVGRPWLFNQNDPFDLRRSLSLASTTPY